MSAKTLLLISQSNDPPFNLATEEHLLRNHQDNIIFLYINSPSVIIGKHQNALSEINLPFLEKKQIPVFRRLSGGGTVYHDEGNINFCIIESGTPGKLVDFKRATVPIIAALNELGVEARHGKRNDLLLGYKKISGNACHVFKSRSLHHGTLLYDSNLEALNESLKTASFRFNDKSVKSVRSEVTNIIESMEHKGTPTSFMHQLGKSLGSYYKTELYPLTREDLGAIEKLKNEKYNTWQWNYGYSPAYEFTKRNITGGYTLSCKLKVEKGVIVSITLQSNHPDATLLKQIEEVLRGNYHEKRQLHEELEKVFSGSGVVQPSLTMEMLMKVLF